MPRKQRRSFGLALAALLLAGCSDEGEALKPGLWERQVTVDRYFIPGAPGTTAKRAQALVGHVQTSRLCVSAEDAQKGMAGLTQSFQGGSCAVKHLALDDNAFKGSLACAGLGLGTAVFRMTGSFTADKIGFALDGEVADPDLPGGMAEATIAVTAQHVGECAG